MVSCARFFFVHTRATHLCQDRLDHVVEEHGLVSRLREDSIKGICLVAQRIWTHRDIDMFAHDTIGLDHDGAILAHLAIAAAPAAHDDIDICLLAELGLEITFLALQACVGRRDGHGGGRGARSNV